MINLEFNSVSEILDAFQDEQSCLEHLEKIRWEKQVVSPFDPTSKVYKCRGSLYKCKNTGKYFNAKTATLFHNSKIALRKWYAAIWLITERKPNISSVEMAQELDLTQKTAWYMIKRIKNYYAVNSTENKKTKKKDIATPPEKQSFVEEKLDLIQWLQQLSNTNEK